MLSPVEESHRGTTLEQVKGEEVCVCEKECVLALEKLKWL